MNTTNRQGWFISIWAAPWAAWLTKWQKKKIFDSSSSSSSSLQTNTVFGAGSLALSLSLTHSLAHTSLLPPPPSLLHCTAPRLAVASRKQGDVDDSGWSGLRVESGLSRRWRRPLHAAVSRVLWWWAILFIFLIVIAITLPHFVTWINNFQRVKYSMTE